ncbi:N-acetylmuramoyl-L-alanine amidase [Robiginitalea sp. SC105]|uniref:N-acetylmuramoyl-L-alanine amidase n=1 Tax=Robiginitalea sp. SC105 TaxID=2762332 RepID=UPI002104CEA5|nr:N-acetylmuramoyl-L-alanine amidase [Robiginitalea sp. SC105]
MGQATPGNAGVPEPFTVVLDAGHGGHDPGNLGNGYLEKNIALNIVLEVGKELEKLPNTKVIYTRKDDSFVDLYVRGEIANKAKADLFVSVHCDSHTSNAHGAGTFVLGLHANEQNFEIAKKENSVIYLEDNYETRYAEYDINSPESVIGLTIMQEEFLDQSILLGKLMQDRFTGELNRNDRKVKQAGFIVLHQTFMPSVLVETGFLTNKEEGRFLNSESGQEKMGKAIAGAIKAYRESLGSEADLGLVAQGQPPINETATTSNSGGVQTAPADTGLPANEEPIPPVTSSPEEAQPPATGGSQQPPAAGKPDAGALSADKPQTTGPATSQDAARAKTLGISFKVQLIAVSRDPDLNSAAFGRLPNLSKEHYQNMYRVLYGDTRSYADAQKLQTFAAQRGYPAAYIVAYHEGNRIPVPKALEMLDN